MGFINNLDEAEQSTQDLIEAARRYLTVRDAQMQKAKKDPAEYPTPTKMSQILKLPVNVVIELGQFAEEELGDVERDFIESMTDGRIDYKTGQIIQEDL